MRTMVRSKITLLFMTLGLLLAIPAIALADIVVADGDGVTGTPHSGTRNLGSVNPGATLNPSVDFYLRCDGNQHFNSDDSADIDFTSGTITDNATNAVAATGSATATSLTGLTGPSSWAPDATGSSNCTASHTDQLLGSSTATIVAPTKAGTYTITLDYTVERAASTQPNELRNNITNEPLTFTLTVNNVAPVINSFQVSATDAGTSATEGQTKTYTITASDANEDTLSYSLTALSGSASTTITGANTSSPQVKFNAPGTVTLRASVSDGVNTAVTQDKTVTVAAANTAPSKPGTPGLAQGSVTPNQGTFGLTWTASSDNENDPITYTLQHKDNNDLAFSNVKSGISGNSYQFGDGPDADELPDNPVEDQGTWTYRVQASDGSLTSDFSAASSAIKVDRGAPNAPIASADRAPEYDGTGTNDWFLDTVTVSFTDDGDPNLPDGSAGSGVDLSTLTAPITKTTSGSHTVNGTVKDNATNLSAAGSLTVQVDATDPNVSISGCPTTSVIQGSSQSVSVTANDAHSDLATDPTNSALALDTSSIGPQTKTVTAVDNVGRSKQASCPYYVVHNYSGVLQPVNGGSTPTFTDDLSIFKLGSTVPLKFQLLGASAPITDEEFFLRVVKISNGVAGAELEAASTAASTTGNLFRYDATSGQYIFNLGTKGLSDGTWEARIYLDNGTSTTPPSGLQGAVRFSLKK